MNLLITGAWQQASEYIEQIEAMGHRVSFLQYEKDSLDCDYEWVEGVICNGLFLYHSIEKFTNLKYIQLTSAGLDRIPLDYIKEKGMQVHTAKGVYSIPMAEYVLGGVLQLYKQAKFFHQNQQNRQWEKHRGLLELYGKTVAVIGCGSVGTECAKRFQAFGCRVIGVNRMVRDNPFFNTMVQMDKLNEVLSVADVVVLSLPLTEDTRYLMNEQRLFHMKEGAVLVNVSRGAVVDEKALIKALKERLGGAVLDVFEEEPLSGDSSLWEMEEVILTPHNSFVGDGCKDRLGKVILDNLASI